MSNLLKKITSYLLVISIFSLMVVLPNKTYAAGSVYLSPGKVSIGQGTLFTVAVRMNSGGDAVNAAQINLNYPTDKLDFVRITNDKSNFPVEAPSSGGGGSVQINRGNYGTGLTGDKLIASVVFKAKQNNGQAVISIAGGSALVRGSDQANIYTGGAGATIILTPPKPAAPKTSTAPNTAPVTTGAAPVISNVHVTNLTLTTATVQWQTDVASTSIVEYGLNNRYGFFAQDKESTKEHKVNLDPKLLVPGTTYHFQVKSSDAANNEGLSQGHTFKLRGYSLKVTVNNRANKPVKKASVTIDNGTTQQSNDSGVVTFSDLSPGMHSLAVKVGSATTTSSVTVNEADPQSGAPQEQIVQVASASNLTLYIVSGVLILAVLTIIAFFTLRKKNTY